MILEYVGPKPIISHSGIEFDKNKEDKYIYLGIVSRLIEALDHPYIEDKKYTCQESDYIVATKEEVLDILKKYCPNINQLLDKTNYTIEEEIQHNLKRAHESTVLNSIEKEVLVKNIEMMHNYMLQRAVNKSVYYCAMKVLADIVQGDHINHIQTPFSQGYMHVLHSLQGTLLKEKAPVDTKLEVYEEKKVLYVRLQVVNILL